MEEVIGMKNCKHCKGYIDMRNPSGYCDHLYYPEYCDICSGKTLPHTQWEEGSKKSEGITYTKMATKKDLLALPIVKKLLHAEYLRGRKQIAQKIEKMKKKQLYQVRDMSGKTTITESRKVFDTIMGDGGSVEKVYNQALKDVRSALVQMKEEI